MKTNNFYKVVEQLDKLIEDGHTPRLELWMDSKSRAELINQLDDSALENKNFSKSHMYYLAINTLSIQELYELIEQKMIPGKFVKKSTSEQTFNTTQRKFSNFTLSHSAIQSKI